MKIKVLTMLALASLAFASAGPAHATGTIECTGVDGSDATVFLLIGRVPVLAVLRAEIEAEGTVYATDAPEGADAVAILFGQGISDADRLRADFTDDNVEEIIISLRTERSFEEKSGVEAGVLRIVGQGAYAVTCLSG